MNTHTQYERNETTMRYIIYIHNNYIIKYIKHDKHIKLNQNIYTYKEVDLTS